MNYVDQFLDQLGDVTDQAIHELYCENHLFKWCHISVDEFEDIYYSLFDDNLSDLEKGAESILYDAELYDDYEERINLLYKELLGKSMETYSYIRFLCEIPKEDWNNIIYWNIELKKTLKKDEVVFNFYKELRNGHKLKGEIPC